MASCKSKHQPSKCIQQSLIIVLQTYFMEITKSITGKASAKSRAIVMLSMAIFLGSPAASAQSFKSILKKAAESVGGEVKKEVKKEVNKAFDINTKASTQTSAKKSAKRTSVQTAKNNGATVNVPANHTALLAPIGEAVDAKFGIKTVKAVKPPQDEKLQPDWNDAQTDVRELDNKSLVEAYLVMEASINSKSISPSSPASFRHLSLFDELKARTRALNTFVEKYNEVMDCYEDEEEGFSDQANRTLASALKTYAYKVVTRSSLAPLFSLDDYFISDATVKYFKDHGGYENAHKASFTVWNPDK